MSDQFNFYGQTSFVNRPTNTVISDFQNMYMSEPANDELAELLNSVLSSEQLGDGEREQAARLIHEVAEEIASTEPEGGKIRTTLESIKAIVSQASDIAGPALGIISKVFELIGS